MNNFLDTKTSGSGTAQKSDKIVVSDWYDYIDNLIFNLSDNSYAFLAFPKDFDPEKAPDPLKAPMSLIYNGKVIERNKWIMDISFKSGNPVRYVELTLSGAQPKYDDAIVVGKSEQIGEKWYNGWEFKENDLRGEYYLF